MQKYWSRSVLADRRDRAWRLHRACERRRLPLLLLSCQSVFCQGLPMRLAMPMSAHACQRQRSQLRLLPCLSVFCQGLLMLLPVPKSAQACHQQRSQLRLLPCQSAVCQGLPMRQPHAYGGSRLTAATFATTVGYLAAVRSARVCRCSCRCRCQLTPAVCNVRHYARYLA